VRSRSPFRWSRLRIVYPFGTGAASSGSRRGTASACWSRRPGPVRGPVAHISGHRSPNDTILRLGPIRSALNAFPSASSWQDQDRFVSSWSGLVADVPPGVIQSCGSTAKAANKPPGRVCGAGQAGSTRPSQSVSSNSWAGNAELAEGRHGPGQERPAGRPYSRTADGPGRRRLPRRPQPGPAPGDEPSVTVSCGRVRVFVPLISIAWQQYRPPSRARSGPSGGPDTA